IPYPRPTQHPHSFPTRRSSDLGSMSLDEALSQREQINAQLQMQMEQVTDKWGIRINRIEIVDIVPPQQILMAMPLQKQADQQKRSEEHTSELQSQSNLVCRLLL